MKRIVISIGGSILLTGENDIQYLRDLSEMLRNIFQQEKIIIVVGGGKLAREYIKIGRELGKEELYLDELGIMATRLNAMALISAFKDNVNPKPYADEEDALADIDNYNTIIMGGTVAGQTTDTVAANLAKGVNADLFINATAVDGVYTADPRKDPEAKRLPTLTFDELTGIVGDSLLKAGTNVVIDPVAAKIIKDNEIRTYVLNGRDLDNFSLALEGKEFRGTIIDK